MCAAAYVIGALAVSTAPWWIDIPVWFIMAWLLVGAGATIHEAVHGHLFAHHWANTLAGRLGGAVTLVPYHVYRSYHIGHHRHLLTPDDPEGADGYKFASRLQYALALTSGVAYVAWMHGQAWRCVVGSGPAWMRGERRALPEALAAALPIAAIAGALMLAPRATLDAWLAPWMIAMTVLMPLVLIPEHYGAVGTDRKPIYKSASTIATNRLVAWVYWHNNLHALHHLAQSVVPQRQDEAQQVLTLATQQQSSGYLRWHATTWRGLTVREQ